MIQTIAFEGECVAVGGVLCNSCWRTVRDGFQDLWGRRGLDRCRGGRVGQRWPRDEMARHVLDGTLFRHQQGESGPFAILALENDFPPECRYQLPNHGEPESHAPVSARLVPKSLYKGLEDLLPHVLWDSHAAIPYRELKTGHLGVLPRTNDDLHQALLGELHRVVGQNTYHLIELLVAVRRLQVLGHRYQEMDALVLGLNAQVDQRLVDVICYGVWLRLVSWQSPGLSQS